MKCLAAARWWSWKGEGNEWWKRGHRHGPASGKASVHERERERLWSDPLPLAASLHPQSSPCPVRWSVEWVTAVVESEESQKRANHKMRNHFKWPRSVGQGDGATSADAHSSPTSRRSNGMILKMVNKLFFDYICLFASSSRAPGFCLPRTNSFVPYVDGMIHFLLRHRANGMEMLFGFWGPSVIYIYSLVE